MAATHTAVAPSGERCEVRAGVHGVFADKTVIHTCSERLRGEVLTMRRYTNLRYTFTFTGCGFIICLI